MGDVIDLHSQPLDPATNHELVVDCCRYLDGTLSEPSMRRKWRYSEAEWQKLGDNAALLLAIDEEQLRRTRSGTTKREKAASLVVRGTDVLGRIMDDVSTSPKTRIEAIKTLDTFSATGPGAAAAGTIFEIRIDLGGGVVEHYRKPVKIDANYTDADINVEPAPAIAINVDDDSIEPAPAAIAINTDDVNIEPTPAIAIDVDDVGSKPQLVASTTPTVTSSKDPVESALEALMAFGG